MSKAERFEAFDGFRAALSIIVFLYHVRIFYATGMDGWGWLDQCYFVVEGFFVLSGFIIAHGYMARINDLQGAWQYMRSRFLRIWPLHFVVLMLFVIMEMLKWYAQLQGIGTMAQPAFTDENSLEALAASFFLLHSMGLFHFEAWNSPAWSISVEFYVYMLFGVMCLIRNRLILSGLALAMMLTSGVVIYFVAGKTNNTYDYGIFRCIFSFMLGFFVYRFYCLAEMRELRLALVRVLLPVALTVLCISALSSSPMVGLWVPFLFAVVVLALAEGKGGGERIMAWRPLAYLGTVSYSFYLWHYLVMLAMARVVSLVVQKSGAIFTLSAVDSRIGFSNVGAEVAWTLLLFFVTLMISAVSYKHIELRFQRLGRRLQPAVAV